MLQLGSRCRSPQPDASGGVAQAQAQGTLLNIYQLTQGHWYPLQTMFDGADTLRLTPDTRARAPILLHGRQMPRLLHHHHRLLARPDRRHLRRLLDGALPADGRKGAVDGGMFVPEKVDVGRGM